MGDSRTLVGGFGVGGGGGAGEPISASLGAQAFLRRRDAVSDTEGVLAYFGDVAAGEIAIAGLGPVGNEWSVRSRERDPGLSAIAGVPDGTTYTSRAFLSSDLNQTDFVARGFDAAITSARWSGTLATRQSAGEGTVVAGEILFYYWEQAQVAGARAIYAISTDADYLFNSFILWQGYTNNNYRGFLREHVKWLHDVTNDNNLTNDGRFANDAAALAYIVENKAYFQGVLTDVIVLGATSLELAYFRTSDDTVRIGTVTFGADGVEGIPGEPTEALAVILHEDDQIIELRYASEATALTPVTRPDNVGEVLAAFNLLNDRGLYALAAGSAANAAAFERDPGLLLPDSSGLVSTFLPRRNGEDTEGVDVWLTPGSDYLDANSPIAAGITLRVYSDADSVTSPPLVSFTNIQQTITFQFELHYNAATATVAQVVAAFNAHSAFGLHASVAEGTAGNALFQRPMPWSEDFFLSDFAPDAWEEDFGGGEDIELESAFYALGPPQSVFTGNTEAAAETARNNYATSNPGWKAAYQADQRLFVLVRWGSSGNEKATVLSEDGITWREIAFAFVGRQGITGTAGTPGGGAIEDTDIVLDLRSAVITANEFMGTGLMLGERGDTPIVLYQLEANALALLWFFTEDLYDLPTASDGDTADVSATGRNALALPESAGSSLSGSVRGGITDAGELLIAFTSDDTDTHVRFWRYIPSAVQNGGGGGLSDADRAELTRLSGVETDATQDQSAAEIAILLDGLIGNAAWRTRLSGADLVAAVDAAVGNALWRSAHTVQRNAQQIVDLLDVALGGDSWRTGGGGGGGLTIGAATDAAGALLATLSQFTYNETDDTLTFVPSPPHLQLVRTPNTAIISGSNVLGGPFGAAAVIPVAGSGGLGVMSSAQAQKLAGIAAAANRLIPYKIGNIYRAFASGANIVKPGNNEGTVTIAGITVAPAGWQLTRPETTAALPHVYDCHVYGYETNSVFGVQYGTPNRTDRYIAPGGTGIDEDTANGLIQDALAAAVMGNTETGITVTHNTDGTLDFVVSGGGTPTPVTDDIYFGTSANDFASSGELTIPGVNGSGVIPAYAGHRHHLIARLATEGDITSVLYSDDPTMANAIGAYIKFGNTLVPPGETEPFTVWITEQALLQAADVTITVS